MPARFSWLIGTFISLNAAALLSAQAPQTPLPSVIEGCYTGTNVSPSIPKDCILWYRDGDSYANARSDFSSGVKSIVKLEHFDSHSFAFSMTTEPDTKISRHYAGTISGNRFEGKIVQTISSPAKPVSADYTWSGWVFYPPPPSARSSEYAFVLCDDQASFINIGDYSVTTIDLKLGNFYTPKSITVSPDGTKAYLSTGGQTPTWYPAKLVTLDATAGKVAQTLSLAKSPVPSGFVSLAMAGDGVTLYGSGVDLKQTTTLIVAMDAASGATLASAPYVSRNPGLHNVNLVMSGTKVALSDGSVADIVSPKGGPAVFGNDGQGLSAFADGQTLCSGGKLLSIGTTQPPAQKPCSANLPPLPTRSGAVSILLGPIQFADDRFTPLTATTPDGKAVFKLEKLPEGQGIYVREADTGLVTSVVSTCKQPTLLGMPPMTR
jgi:hypothetical protein